MTTHRVSRTPSTTILSGGIRAASTAPTLAAVMAGIEADNALSKRRRQDMLSALRTVGRVLRRPLAELPAHPSALRNLLKEFAPSQAGMSERYWCNVSSLLRSTLQHAGISHVPARHREPMSDGWTALLRSAAATAREHHGLSRLARYCTLRQVEPAAVDDTLFSRFAGDLDASDLNHSAAVTHRRLATIWNGLAAKLPGGPCRPVSVPVDPRKLSLPWSDFPISLQKEVAAYFRRLSEADVLDDDGVKRCEPATIDTLRWQLQAYLSAMVHLGRSTDTLTCLSEAIKADVVKPTLRFFNARAEERSARQPTDQAYRIACCVLTIAKTWVRPGPEEIEKLRDLCKRLHPGPGSLTPKNQARLRQFDDPANVAALLTLPHRLAARAARCRTPSRSDALEVQTAVAIEILLMVPIRRGNLARLDIHRHLIRSRGGVVHLYIPAEEVKNRTAVEAVLPAETVRLIDIYLSRYRPLLLDAPSPWLFPGIGGGSKCPVSVGMQISSGIHRHCGLQMNTHLFRHLAAKLYLDSHPGAYGVVRLVNGHKSVNTTTTYYCGTETAAAMRHFDRHVLELRRQAEEACLPTEGKNKPAGRSRAARPASHPEATQ